MKITNFGTTVSGESVDSYTIENNIASLTILSFGGIIQNFKVHGISIVGGYDTIEDYEADDSHQGGLIGRIANRVANACFEMDGKKYEYTNTTNTYCHGQGGKEN